MRWFSKQRVGSTIGTVALAAAIALVLSLLGLRVEYKEPSSGLTVGRGGPTIVVGIEGVHAAGTADYTADGVDDDVQLQAALDALPVGGGQIVVLAGTYSLSNTVTRVLDNVTWIGEGRGTYLTNDGVTALLTAGGDNWIFSNLRTDAGGINMGVTTGGLWTGVTVATQLYSYYAPTLGIGAVYNLTVGGGRITGNVTVSSGVTIDGIDISSLNDADSLSRMMFLAYPWQLDFDAGNVQTVVNGSGYGNFDQQDYVDIRTGVNASSSMLAWYPVTGGTSSNWARVDFSRRMIGVIPLNPSSFYDANTTMRAQMKESALPPSVGNLTSVGIGVIVRGAAFNYYFENYEGGGRTETNLNWTPAGNDRTAFVVFDHEPSVPRIRVQVFGGGAPPSAVTTITSNVPTTFPVPLVSWVYSIENGASAADQETQNPKPLVWFLYE